LNWHVTYRDHAPQHLQSIEAPMIETLLSQAGDKLRAGDTAAARALLEDALARSGEDAKVLRMLGTAHYLAGQHAEAIDFFSRSLEVVPETPKTLANLGAAYLDSGDYMSAVEVFSKVVALIPDNGESYFNLGVSQQRAGRMGEAREALTKALELDPGLLDAEVNMAAVALSIGDTSASLHYSERVLRRQPRHRQARLSRLWALTRAGALDDSMSIMKSLQEDFPADVAVDIEWARLLVLLGRYTEAVSVLEDVRAREPDNKQSTIVLASALHETGQFQEAVDVWRTCFEHGQASANVHSGLASSLDKLGHAADADTAFERAIEVDPDSYLNRFAYARALLARDDFQRADALLQQVTEMAPVVAPAHVLRAQVRLRTQRYAEALDVCAQYLDKHPRERSLLAVKALTLAAMGRVDEAAALMDYSQLLSMTTLATPEEYGSLSEFNAALSVHVRDHPSLTGSPQSHATRDGFHSGPLRVSPRGPIDALEKALNGAARQYLRTRMPDPGHPFLAETPELGMLNCWGVVMHGQGHQTAHIHPAAWVSGVYYPRVPDLIGTTSEHEGWLEFGAAPDDFGLPDSSLIHAVQPAEGLLVIFPSYFFHRTVPFESKQERISIAFDIMPSTRGTGERLDWAQTVQQGGFA